MKFAVASVAAMCAAAVIGINAGTAAVLAQGGQDKMGPDQMGKMDMHDHSYTGCVEAGKTPRTYTLTHVTDADDRMGSSHMGKDAMGKDSMAKDSMDMSKDAMGPTTLAISSKSVDLSKQVGHKVTVSGAAPAKMDAMSKDAMGKDAMGMAPVGPTFTIKTLKVIASSCQ